MKLFLIILLIFGTSCSRYHFKTSDNPFLSYDIKSISVPMFVNWSSVPNVAGPMTASFINLLMDYSKLKIYSREKISADAILIGVIQSKKKRRDVFKNVAYQTTTGNLKDSIGKRREFYIPQNTSVQLKLRILLIKDPNQQVYQQALSKNSNYLNENSKVIFDETISLETIISRVIRSNTGVNNGGAVNFTKGRKALSDAVLSMVDSATQTFQKEILDAF